MTAALLPAIEMIISAKKVVDSNLISKLVSGLSLKIGAFVFFCSKTAMQSVSSDVAMDSY